MTSDLFLNTRIHYDPELDELAMDHQWQNFADAARQAGHPAYISAPDDLTLKLQRQQSLTYGSIADHLPLHHPYHPQIQSYYRHNAASENFSAGYTPLSPPHSSYNPSLGSSGCGTNSRHTSPSVSETSSSRTGSWPTNPIDQQTAGGGYLPQHIAQHPQAVGYLAPSFGYHHTAHNFAHLPSNHTVIAMNQVQLSQDEFQLAQGDASEHDTPTVGTTGCSSLQQPQRGSSDDADGDTVDADSTEMDVDQGPVSDNDETMSEATSDRDAEGEDEDDDDYNPNDHSRKKSRTSRRSLHRRTTSNSSNASQGPGPARSTKSKGKGKKRNPPSQVRAFPCPLAIYGCLESFDSKNEWKRHINTQHVPITIFRCKFCCPPSKTRAGPYKSQRYDFVRKDLFTMHLKRMHAAECNIDPLPASTSSGSRRRQKDSSETIRILGEISKQCETRIRDPPEQVECILCHHTFNGLKCWEERIEHIATGHFEAARKQNIGPPGPEEWHHDEYLEEWLIRENIIKRGRDGRWQCD